MAMKSPSSFVSQANYSQRVLIKDFIGRSEIGQGLVGQKVLVESQVYPLTQLTSTGSSVMVEGELKQPPEGTKQTVELKVEKVLEVGTVDPSKYPIAKTRLSMEHLRSYVHLRPRTNTDRRNELATRAL